MTTLPSTHIDFILHDITLTDYYNAKNTFRSQVITVKQIWKKNNRVNIINTLPSIHIDFILYLPTITMQRTYSDHK